jgi:hypothetical protein
VLGNTFQLIRVLTPSCDLPSLAPRLAQIANKHKKSFIVDAMSSFGAVPIDINKAHIDYIVSSANKCIEGLPGAYSFFFIFALFVVLSPTTSLPSKTVFRSRDAGFSFVVARKSALAASKGLLLPRSHALSSESCLLFRPFRQRVFARAGHSRAAVSFTLLASAAPGDLVQTCALFFCSAGLDANGQFRFTPPTHSLLAFRQVGSGADLDLFCLAGLLLPLTQLDDSVCCRRCLSSSKKAASQAAPSGALLAITERASSQGLCSSL